MLTRRLARPRQVQALDGSIIIINRVTMLLMAVLARVCHLFIEVVAALQLPSASDPLCYSCAQ